MKKTTSILIAALMAFVLSSFSSLKDESTDVKPRIPVGDENFIKLVSFIENNGLIKKEKNNCSYSYSFFDKNGNEYNMSIIKTNEKGKGPMSFVNRHISCILFCKGLCEKNYFFITKERVVVLKEKNLDLVEKGFTLMLSKANENKNFVLNSN